MNQTFKIDLPHIITQFAVYTAILPVFLFLIFNSKVKDKGIRVILFLVFIGFWFDVYSLYLISKKQDNIVFFNLFNFIETASLLLYFHHLATSRKIKLFIISSFVIFSVVWSFYFLNKGSITFLDVSVIYEYVIVIIFCLLFFFQLLKTPSSPVFSSRNFWIVTAYMLYISGTFFLFLYFFSLTPEEQKEYYIVNYVFLIIKTIFLSVAMTMKQSVPERKKFQLT